MFEMEEIQKLIDELTKEKRNSIIFSIAVLAGWITFLRSLSWRLSILDQIDITVTAFIFSVISFVLVLVASKIIFDFLADYFSYIGWIIEYLKTK